MRFLFLVLILFCGNSQLLIAQPIKIIANTESGSPIINFITKRVQPFVEARMDAILLKLGFNDMLQKFGDPNLEKMFKYTISNDGDGRVLKCGQMARMNIELFDNNMISVNDDLKNNDASIVIGLSKLGKAIDVGTIGMKESEVRLIQWPKVGHHSISINAPKKEYSYFNVKLNHIEQSARDIEIENFDIEKMRHYDIIKNINELITCGSIVKPRLKLLDAKGALLFDSNSDSAKDTYSYFIGSGRMPIILENGLIGMHKGDQRIFLVNSSELALLKSIFPNYNIKNNIDLILDVSI